MRELAGRVDSTLDSLLPPATALPATLHEAMRYSVLGGGKRVRPVLAILAAEACGVTVDTAVDSASAIELVHTYSLIHDDLPEMDDDDYRRGRPSCHVVFGAATAVLAGDALQTLAFEVLALHPEGAARAAIRAEAVALVARASGSLGMVGGQEMDLRAEGGVAEISRLEAIHERKTRALLHASVMLGAVLAQAGEDDRRALDRYGRAVGLAFQITDDILDVSGDLAQLGKTPGKDARAGKVTYPSLLGLDASRRRAEELAEQARAAISPLGERGRWLGAMATYIVERMS